MLSIQQATFQGLFALVTVVAPGCVDYGVRAFAECCALQQGGAIDNGANVLAPGATLAPYAFEKCLRLSQITLPQVLTRPKIPPLPPPYRGIPQGCFHSSGLASLLLPAEVNFIGPQACENCKHLVCVDLSITMLKAISKHTFSHCVGLAQVRLPSTLQEIHAEAFADCEALEIVDVPPALRYTAHKAFANCSRLLQLNLRQGKRTTWRGAMRKSGPFELCSWLEIPRWINHLPPDKEYPDE